MGRENVYDSIRTAETESVTIQEALIRGVHEVLPPDTPESSLRQQMQERRIKLYLGIDPTSPHLHIGHSVPLRKLRQFQELGHEVVLLFGTFTGMIGDPTDKSAQRVRLTENQIAQNVATYAQQAGKILDLSPEAANPITIAYNHEWLNRLTFAEVVDLMANFTTEHMLSRSMFQRRKEDGKPVWLHELMYPLMQGWDSVAMGVDLEVGGKDQTFNMMVGRTLVNRYLEKEKWVLSTKLIEDPDGKKMGKTEGNIVNLDDWPEWLYEAIMTWPDSTVPLGLELLTDVPTHHIEEVATLLKTGEINPMEAKRALAYRAVFELNDSDTAHYAEEEFDAVVRKRAQPKRIQEVGIERPTNLNEVLVMSSLAKDPSEAAHLIASCSVYVDGVPVKKNLDAVSDGSIIKVGNRTLRKQRRVVFVQA